VRLLLDVHLSGRVIAPALRELGHDVRAANEEQGLDRLSDFELLSLAAAESRILVTANIKDFMPLVRRRGKAGEHHAGCIFIPSRIRQHFFGRIISGIRAAVDDVPDQQQWVDRVQYLK